MNLQAFPSSGISRATLLATSLGLSVVSNAVEPNIIKLDNTTALNDGASWSGGVAPGSGDIAVWDATVTTANTTVLGGDLSWAGIRIANPGGLVTVNTGNTLTLGSAGIDLSAATQNLTLANAVSLGAAQTWNVADTRTLSSTNGIAGAGTLVKSGSGTLTLSGATNTYNGGLTISAGTVVNSSYTGLGTGTVTLGDTNTGSSDVILSHQSSTGTSQATNITVSANGSGLAKVTWNQDWWGTTGKGFNTANDWTLTLNRMVNFQSSNSGKQIAPFVTGSGVAAGDVAVKVDGGTQVTWTSAMNSGNTAVQVNNFTGNVWVTGNTKLQGQNRAYQSNTASYYNGLIPDSSTLIVDSGSTFQLHHGAETIGFLSGAGSVLIGSGTNGNALTISGSSSTPAAGGQTGTATFSGTFSTNQSALTKSGTGTQEFSGTGITYSQGTNLNNGTLKLSMTTGWNSNVTFSASDNPTLQFNTPLVSDTWTCAKQLNGGSGTATVEKIGAGSLTLSGGGSFAGALKVSEGKLLIGTGFGTAGPVTMLNGTHFGGAATVANITTGNGVTLEGGNGGSGTLNAGNVVIGSIATDTATLKGTLSTAAGYKPLSVSGLTVSGGNQSVLLDAAGAGLVNGTAYDVLVSASPITAPNASSVLSAFKSNSRTYTPLIDGTGTKVQLIYDQNASIYWVGSSGGNWNTSATQNWKLTGNNAFTQYQANDTVLFHNSPANPDVNIDAANVTPAAVVFDNTTTTDYTLGSTGDFGIVTGSITKNNNGLVTIQNHNPTTGPVSLNGGNVLVWWDDSLGSGPINFGGGKLTYDATVATWSRNITVNGGGGVIDMTNNSGTLTHTGSLGGSGILSKEGVGTLALAQTSGTVTANLQLVDGTLQLNYGGGDVTYSGNITGSTGVLRLDGTGASPTAGITITGNNSFSGETHVYGRRIFLNSGTPNGGMGGNIIVKSGNWAFHGLTIMANEQVADTAVLRFEQTNDAYDFRLNGKTETLAGIESLGVGQQANGTFCIIENAGHDGGNDSGIAAGSLIVAGSGTYNYYGQLRNQNGGSNGALSFTKAGTGTQLLNGTGINYTDATTVNGGNLILESTTAFASSGVTVNGGTLTVNNPTGTGTGTCPAVTIKTGATLAGSGSAGGTTTIEAGGTVAPGNSAGTLTLEAATLAGAYQCQLDGASGDQLAVTGSLTIDPAATISVSTLSAPTEASYTILTYGSLVGTLPTITGVPSGYSVDTSTTGQVKLVTGSAFDSWINGFASLTNPADKTITADPDHDGLANVIEFVLNGDPTNSTITNLPTLTASGTNMVFTYTRRDDSESLAQAVEFDADLAGTWTTAVDGSNCTIVVTENGTNPDTVAVTIPKGANPKLFARLKVTP